MKKKKIIKIVFALILIFLLISIYIFVRKIQIINKISKAYKDNFLNTNNSHSLILEYSNSEQELYYKDGISKSIIKKDNEVSIISWHNEKNKETIYAYPKELKASITTSDSDLRQDILENLLLGFLKDNTINIFSKYYLKTETMDNKECYLLVDKEWGGKYYFDKENCEIFAIRVGGNTEGIGEKIIFKHHKSNTLNDEDIAKPDLTGYYLE